MVACVCNFPSSLIFFVSLSFDIFQLALHFGKVWVSNHSSQAIMQLVPKDKRLSKLSPIAIMKAIKNPTEIQGRHGKRRRQKVKISSKGNGLII